MSLLYKKGEELQKQKDRMSGPMNLHISQQISQRTYNTRQDQLENLVAISFTFNQTPQQALDRQKQIKENHINSMQTPIGTEGILQQATHFPTLQESKMSPMLPHLHLQDLPIGGRLTHYISEWQKIRADTLISRGIKAYWLHKECPEILARYKCISLQNRSKQSLESVEDLIQKELQEDIVEEVQLQDLSWVNPCFAIPKAEQGKWRKITDCSILNKFLRGTHFIMEDMMTLRQIIQSKDFMIKIDLEMAFHHIPVDPAFRPFLGFHHNNRFFRYKAMCFGVKHAPLVFNKTLKLIMKVIREQLQIRCIAYCDDLLFLSQSKEELEEKKTQIIIILEQFGWKFSEKKSVLEPQQTTEFLGWEICTQTDQIRMGEDRRQKMLQQINRWIKIIQKQTLVKVKALASFIGKLNFRRMQIRRGGLHMSKLNKVKSWGELKKGWISKLYINRSTLQEIYWWKKKKEENKPIRPTIHQPQAILTTDASATSWGATLKLQNPEEEVWFQWDWSDKWKLSSSKQRERAAVLCALTRYEHFLRRQRVTALKIETDNSVSSFNLNRGAAAVSLQRLTDKILEKLEDLGLQIQAFHIHGIENTIPDSLSRLATSGDYSLRSEVLLEVLSQFQVKPTIDMFSNRRNRKFKRFVSVTRDRWAVTQDSLSMSWKSEIPYLHPPIPLIPATLSKLKREGVQALLIVPNWPSQPWWPELRSMMSRFMILGESKDLLVPGGRMKKQKRHLPPGKLIAVWIEGTEEKN
ncbi:MAG: putative reverse transcriptase, partial [Streblomastix strix]